MRNGTGFKTGIVAVIGAGLLAVTPTISSARSPQGWDICPAIDSEPVCELAAQPAADGAGGRPATVTPPARPSNDVAADISCPSRPIYTIVACAG
jgi:hypothetical protein